MIGQVEGFAVPHGHVGGSASCSVAWTCWCWALVGAARCWTGPRLPRWVSTIKLRLVIPVQYATTTPPEGCDLATIEIFLEDLPATIPVERPGPTTMLSNSLLGEGAAVHVLELDSD